MAKVKVEIISTFDKAGVSELKGSLQGLKTKILPGLKAGLAGLGVGVALVQPAGKFAFVPVRHRVRAQTGYPCRRFIEQSVLLLSVILCHCRCLSFVNLEPSSWENRLASNDY